MLEPYGISFWDVHGFWFCCFMFLFPRLTMLFTGICFAPYTGFLFWAGWLLTPRLTVAFLATFLYFHTNPILCVLVWLWAFSGESAEKKYCSRCKNED